MIRPSVGRIRALTGEPEVSAGRSITGSEGTDQDVEVGVVHLFLMLLSGDVEPHELGVDCAEFSAEFRIAWPTGCEGAGEEEDEWFHLFHGMGWLLEG